jgi:hypothetical protein
VTLASLQNIVWADLPIRKRLVGRTCIDDIVQLAVESWPVDYMNAAVGDSERQVVAKDIERSIKRLHQACSGKDAVTYGLLWTIVLQAIVYMVVQRVLQWWLERRANRALLVAWKHELTK